jgi:DedD protein
MAVDSAVDQVLALKKRARRRLVGAIALVLLMLIILPNVLKDRAQETQPASIALTMPEAQQSSPMPEEVTKNTIAEPVEISPSPVPNLPAATLPSESSSPQTLPEENVVTKPETALSKPLPNPEPKIAHEVEQKPPVVAAKEVTTSRYLIQVGVFSDAENVKKLQKKISEAGFSSRTAMLKTPKGEKIRLRVGTFVTRDAAADALKKLEAHGLSGMVLTDE